jgi:hypothetical protein
MLAYRDSVVSNKGAVPKVMSRSKTDPAKNRMLAFNHDVEEVGVSSEVGGVIISALFFHK